MMSFLASLMPLASIRLGRPTPAPASANKLECSLVHFFQSVIILSSSALRFSGGVFIHSSTTACGARYKTRNFAMRVLRKFPVRVRAFIFARGGAGENGHPDGLFVGHGPTGAG